MIIISKLEKTDLKIGFIPIICSAPLIYAHSHGIFEKNGLNVEMMKPSGWSGIKDLLVYDYIDAAHMLSPMPLACSMGLDGKEAEIKLATILNINGQAITLSNKHLGIKNVRDMEGFTFGVPYRFSMHYYLLCYFLAANGLNPLEDVVIKEVAPPIMPYYLRKGKLDGYLTGEPYNQLAVYKKIGFIYILSKDIWAGHPCCAFATTQKFIDKYPNTYRTMLKSVLEAEYILHIANTEERIKIAKEISGPYYIDQKDYIPIAQALSGEYPNGKGENLVVLDRIDFIPYPWKEYGTWMLTQMQRLGQSNGGIKYEEIVESVFQTEENRDLAISLGFKKDSKPSLGGTEPFTGENPFDYMLKQPYCAFQEESKPLKTADLSETIQEPLLNLIKKMAAVTGGNLEQKREITHSGVIGDLQQIFNELTTNMRFMKDQLLASIQESTKTLEELKRSNEELEQFAYVASHDLQEPLRMVASFMQLIEKRYANKLDKDGKEFIQYAVDGANRMQGLINDLLDFSRVTTQGKEFKLNNFQAILDNVLANLNNIIIDNKAVIMQDPMPIVLADGPQIMRVFQNLIENAIKFRGKEVPHIYISAKEKKIEWEFSISDNGIGIDPKFFNRLFIIFQRLHTKTEYNGTGIGLAISKRIINRHGGRIWIKSEPGKGSTFFFTLPKE